jgi:bifunctional non-homologous end joining protein LigD
MQDEHITLHFKQGSADKVYKASIERLEKDPDNCGWVVNFAYGRRGKPLKTGTKTPKPLLYEGALVIYDKLITTKMSKGYTPDPSGKKFYASGNAPKITGWLPQLLNEVYKKDLVSVFAQFAPNVWVQTKHNGERRGVLIDDIKITPANRKGLETTIDPKIMESLAKLVAVDGVQFILDTEDMGDHLVIFDLIVPVEDEKPLTFEERADMLILLDLGIQHLKIVELRVDVPQKMASYVALKNFVQRAEENNEEGVVIRDGNSIYTPGKPNSGGTALKLKFWKSATCIVESVHPTKRSIGLGMYPQGDHPVGNCTIPANHEIPNVGDLVEIRYLYAYRGGSLYQPIYEGIRNDLSIEAACESQLQYIESDD